MKRVLVDRSLLLLVLMCMLLLPLVIVSDEVLYSIYGEAFASRNVLIQIGFHLMNLQSIIAVGFYLAAILILAATIMTRAPKS